MEQCGFFGSINGDRKYKSEDFAGYFAAIVGNGVVLDSSTSLQVVPGSGMNITLNPGRAWINGYSYRNTTALTIPLAAADGILNRKDRVVIRWDLSNRTIKAAVISYSYTNTPGVPEIQRTSDLYELAVAEITIRAGAIEVTAADITDLRADSGLCGYVTGVNPQIDSTTLFAQFQSSFNEWFSAMTAFWTGTDLGSLEALIKGHAARHVYGGADALTPENIRAAPAREIVTNTTSTTAVIALLQNNTEYRFTRQMTSINIQSAPSGYFNCRLLLTVGSGLVITLPPGMLYAGGSDFSFQAGDRVQLYIDQDGSLLVPFRNRS